MTEAPIWQSLSATLRPRRDSSDGLLPPLLLALTLVTGLVDATSYLKLGHVFVANMTGNVVFLGFGIAGAGGISVSFIGGTLVLKVDNPAPLALATALLAGISFSCYRASPARPPGRAARC